MNKKELARIGGVDFATGRIRSLAEATPNYLSQPYMPHLLAVQKILIAEGRQGTMFVEHKDVCGGRSNGWAKGVCDCVPVLVLYFVTGEEYRYRTTDPDAEEKLRTWFRDHRAQR